MVGLNYKGDKLERVYAAELNNMAYANKNGTLTGCVVSGNFVPQMFVNVTSGKIFFGINVVSVPSVQNVIIASNSSGMDRIDLISVNSSGAISVIQGTASLMPVTPVYDPEVQVILAMITVPNGITALTNVHIKDIRVLNVGGSGSGGGTFKRHIQPFTAQTAVTVTHNLGDSDPVVQVINSNGDVMSPLNVNMIDTNSLIVTFSYSTSGKILVIGGTGVNNAYFSQQFATSTTVNVIHNLNNADVLVQTINSAGVNIAPTSVTRVDANNVTVVFGTPQSGTVIVVGGVSTTDILSEEPSKVVDEIRNISVTSTSSTVTTTLSSTNSLLIVNEGTSTCYIDFSAVSTIGKFPMLAKSKLYLRDVNLGTISAITAGANLTNLKIQFFSGPKIGKRTHAQIVNHSVNSTSQTTVLLGAPSFKYIFMMNVGMNNVYYNFGVSVTNLNGVAIFPNDYIELNNINAGNISSISNVAQTTDLRVLNIY